MRKDWILIGIVGLILVVGLGLIGYLKIGKKSVVTNPIPSSSQEVAGVTSDAIFSADAKVMFFYSDVCSHCERQRKEVLPNLAKQGYRLKPMDVYTNPGLGKQYGIEGVPTYLASNGDRLVGEQTEAALKAWLDQHK